MVNLVRVADQKDSRWMRNERQTRAGPVVQWVGAEILYKDDTPGIAAVGLEVMM